MKNESYLTDTEFEPENVADVGRHHIDLLEQLREEQSVLWRGSALETFDYYVCHSIRVQIKLT